MNGNIPAPRKKPYSGKYPTMQELHILRMDYIRIKETINKLTKKIESLRGGTLQSGDRILAQKLRGIRSLAHQCCRVAKLEWRTAGRNYRKYPPVVESRVSKAHKHLLNEIQIAMEGGFLV